MTDSDWSPALSWRIIDMPEKPGWFYMAFEARTEAPGTRDLTVVEEIAYLDSVVSVSAVDRDRDQLSIDGCEGPSASAEGLLPF